MTNALREILERFDCLPADAVVPSRITAIILGLFVIGGITYTYMTRPALIDGAVKRVMDIRQLFEETFR